MRHVRIHAGLWEVRHMQNSKYWFPAKRYGWGWGLPISWQGWVVLMMFLVLILIGILVFKPHQHTSTFLIYTAVITIGFVIICYLKGEPPAWRWGK